MASEDDQARAAAYAANEDRLVQLKIRTERMEHASRRFGMLLKLPFALLWLALLVWLAVITRSAWSTRGIVIDSFRVSSTAAAAGMDGDAFAARIRNRLIAMQAATASSRLAGVQPINRVEDNRIEIPQTGVTLGEVNGWIRRRLSRDMRVSGDLVRVGTGYVATVRIDDFVTRIPAADAEADLDAVATRVAETIFQKINPYRYGVYLWTTGRPRESTEAFLRLADRRVDVLERAWALNGLAANLLDEGRCREAIPILRQAARLGPRIANIHGNLRNAHSCLGQDQAAADSTAEELRLLAGAVNQLDPAAIEWIRLQDGDNAAGQTGDYRRRLAIYDEMEAGGHGDPGLQRVHALAELHDAQASLSALLEWYAVRRWDTAQFQADRPAFWRARYAQAAALQQWADAAIFAERANRFATSSPSAFDRFLVQTADLPLEAIALARSGEANRATEIVGGLPLDCYLCLRSRAAVADARGDAIEADRWYARAVASAPRLTFAYSEWGESLLRRRNARAALMRFMEALAHGPNHADARKGLGDAFQALGQHREAELSYRAAATLAPQWGALQMAWGGALWDLGRRQEARERLRAADRMSLGPADRQRLQALLAVARAP